jgi:hypothetical protein
MLPSVYANSNNILHSQMAQIDENQEVIASIRMAVDNYDKTRQLKDADDKKIPDEDEHARSDTKKHHWSVGAPEHSTTAKSLKQEFQHKPSRFFQQFDTKLKSFLRKHISADCIDMHEPLKVQSDQSRSCKSR